MNISIDLISGDDKNIDQSKQESTELKILIFKTIRNNKIINNIFV